MGEDWGGLAHREVLAHFRGYMAQTMFSGHGAIQMLIDSEKAVCAVVGFGARSSLGILAPPHRASLVMVSPPGARGLPWSLRYFP